MKRIALFLSLLTITACSSGSPEENAGKAMAETACLLFDQSVSLDRVQSQSEKILNGYGFKTMDDVTAYINSIRGTTSENEVVIAVRDHLEKSCGDALDSANVNASDLAQSMVDAK